MRAAADRIGGWIGGAVDEHGPVIVLGRCTIEGMTTRDTDFELHSSNEAVVPLTAFAPAALTIVGHIHREQELTPTVIGAGDLYRCSFAEAEDEKGYVLVSAAHDGVSWTRRRVGARPMLVYSIELDAITSDWVAEVGRVAALTNAEVKIRPDG
jgi:DNA repair exonuclease SbcCD nuclease subunit